MTELALSAQRILVQDPRLLASGLIGTDVTWPPGWVFPDVPGARIENSQKCAIVIFEDAPWTDPNSHNFAEFGTLVVDIWADPTRNTDKSVRRSDAQDKITSVAKIVSRNFHLVHPSVSPTDPTHLGAVGMPRIWGTAAQVAARTGLTIVSSAQSGGPEFAPMVNNFDGWRGRYKFNVQYSS